MNWRSLLLLAVTILLILFTIAVFAAAAPDPLTFKETDLEPLEPVYENALDLDRPLYRLGEIVRLASNREQMAVIFDYRFDGRQWNYVIRKCHWAK